IGPGQVVDIDGSAGGIAAVAGDILAIAAGAGGGPGRSECGVGYTERTRVHKDAAATAVPPRAAVDAGADPFAAAASDGEVGIEGRVADGERATLHPHAAALGPAAMGDHGVAGAISAVGVIVNQSAVSNGHGAGIGD